jgi:hypothetical protein
LECWANVLRWLVVSPKPWVVLGQRIRLTPREPDSLEAAALSLPDVVKSESNLPA